MLSTASVAALLCLSGTPIMAQGTPLCPAAASGSFDYGEALQKSLYFYEAQQAGELHPDNRVAWRGPSVLDDGSDVGLNLSGGWFDAGDHVKFGFPMASAATLLAWGGVDFRDAYECAGQLDELMNSLKHVNDYFIAAHPSPSEFYGQVGQGQPDHNFWGPPEVTHLKTGASRTAFKVEPSCAGPELVAETAAAMAASAMVFESTAPGYAATLLSHARELYAFAESSAGTGARYDSCITDARTFYPSSGYWDELAWAAMWLWRATGEDQFLVAARDLFDKFAGNYTWSLSWDSKEYAVFALMAIEVGKLYPSDPETQRYHDAARRYLDHWSIGAGARMDDGIVVVDQWGVNRYVGNIALVALYYAQALGPGHALYSRYHTFGKRQMDYILGDNRRASSYMVGFGANPPLNVHHRGAHGSWLNDIDTPLEQRHILYGAIVGGPPDNRAAHQTTYVDDRREYVMNEVATDYNSGATGALALLYYLYGGEPLTDFPPLIAPEPEAIVARASVVSRSPSSLRLDIVVQNRSATPARSYDDFKVRYFLDLSELIAAGLTPDDLVVSANLGEATSLSGPLEWEATSALYYLEVDFAGVDVYPGGDQEHRAETQFEIALPGGADPAAWDVGNDPSWDSGYDGAVEPDGLVAPGIALYGGAELLWGTEPTVACGPGTPVNCVPTAMDIDVSTEFETPVTITLVGSDSDGTIGDWVVVAGPSDGTLTGSGATRTYTPYAGFSGSDSFTYHVIDDQGDSSRVATVTIVVNPPIVPEVTITSPAAGSEVPVGEGFALAYHLSDAHGVRVYVDGALAVDHDLASPVTVNAPSRAVPFTVELVALDANGQELAASDSATYVAVVPQAAVCDVDYRVSEWPDGFKVEVVITNTSDALIQGYTLSWDLGPGLTFSSGWNASFSQTGSDMSASNPAKHWNGDMLPNDGTSNWGFVGSKGVTTSVPLPESFSLNGQPCTGGSGPVEPPPNRAPSASFTVSVDGLTVSVDGRASSDPDGDVLTLAWNFGDGSPLVFGDTATHTFATGGVYGITLTVNDSEFSDTASTAVTVNRPPSASFVATADALTVTFDANASSDPDGDGLTYSWSFGDGQSGSGPTLTHTYPDTGNYQVTLVVGDGLASDSSTSTVAVQAPNRPPTASFVSLVDALGVNADGTSSSDPDGDPLTYRWDFGDGSGPVTGSRASHVYTTSGNYDLSLTVSDGELSHTVTRTVGVSARPSAEFVAAVEDLIVSVDASGSSDPDGDVLDYRWDFGDGSGGAGIVTDHVYAASGTYVISLTVSDGISDVTVSRSVTVVQPNRPPTATFSATTAGLGVQVDGASSSDPDGDSLTWAWDFGDGATATGSTAQHDYALPGTYTISLSVSDGELTDTTTRTVTVEEPPPLSANCTYTVRDDWGAGFVAVIRITNTGAQPISGWEVSWQYDDGSRITNLWNANLSGSNPYSASSLSWNGYLAPGSSAEFGFQGNNGGSAAASPAVTGSICQ